MATSLPRGSVERRTLVPSIAPLDEQVVGESDEKSNPDDESDLDEEGIAPHLFHVSASEWNTGSILYGAVLRQLVCLPCIVIVYNWIVRPDNAAGSCMGPEAQSPSTLRATLKAVMSFIANIIVLAYVYTRMFVDSCIAGCIPLCQVLLPFWLTCGGSLRAALEFSNEVRQKDILQQRRCVRLMLRMANALNLNETGKHDLKKMLDGDVASAQAKLKDWPVLDMEMHTANFIVELSRIASVMSGFCKCYKSLLVLAGGVLALPLAFDTLTVDKGCHLPSDPEHTARMFSKYWARVHPLALTVVFACVALVSFLLPLKHLLRAASDFEVAGRSDDSGGSDDSGDSDDGDDSSSQGCMMTDSSKHDFLKELEKLLDASEGPLSGKSLVIRICELALGLWGWLWGFRYDRVMDILRAWQLAEKLRVLMPLNNDFDRRLTRIASMEEPIRITVDERAMEQAALSKEYIQECQQGKISMTILAEQLLLGFRYHRDLAEWGGQFCNFVRNVLIALLTIILCSAPALLAGRRDLKRYGFVGSEWRNMGDILQNDIEAVRGNTTQAVEVAYHDVRQVFWMEFFSQLAWVVLVSHGFWTMFWSCEQHLVNVFGTLVPGYAALGNMLQGELLARENLVPHVGLDFTQGILMWSELHGLLCSAAKTAKRQGEVALGFVIVNLLGSMCAVIFYLTRQNEWTPGLLSAYAVITLFATLVSSVPLLFKGFLFNLTLVRQVSLLTELHLEVSRLLCHHREPSSSTPSHGRNRLRGSSNSAQSPLAQVRASGDQTQNMIRAICMSLEQEGVHGFRLLGVPLTLQGLGSIASTVAALASFAARKLDILPILKEHKF